MSFRRSALALLPLAATLALAACHDREPEKAETDNEVNMTDPSLSNMTDEPEAPASAPQAPAAPANVTEAPKHAPAPEIPEEQQVLDDAAAVGMTARISRTVDAPAPAPEDKPTGKKPKAEAAHTGGKDKDKEADLAPIY